MKNYNKELNYNVNVYIPKDLANDLKDIAFSSNVSLSAIIRIALTKYVKENKEK